MRSPPALALRVGASVTHSARILEHNDGCGAKQNEKGDNVACREFCPPATDHDPGPTIPPSDVAKANPRQPKWTHSPDCTLPCEHFKDELLLQIENEVLYYR